VAPVLAHKIDDAGLPLIAFDIPHPHSTFFGGRQLFSGVRSWGIPRATCQKSLGGKVRWIFGLDIEEAGPLVQSRITGAFEGVRSTISGLEDGNFIRLDGRGMRDKSYRLVFDFLRRNPQDRGILIAAATDTSALGAVQAVRELKMEKHVAIVGQDCIPESSGGNACAGKSPHWIGFSRGQSYGPRLIQLGLALLAGQRVSPYNYVEHRLIAAPSARE